MHENFGIGKVVCRGLQSGWSRRALDAFDFIESTCHVIHLARVPVRSQSKAVFPVPKE